jgi:hypothetical protein
MGKGEGGRNEGIVTNGGLNPPNTVSPMAAMNEKTFTFSDLPPSFMDETGRLLGDYSVALGFSSATFSMDEIKDLSKLVMRLKAQSDQMSGYLWNRLTKQEQSFLKTNLESAASVKRAQDILVQALNTIIGGPSVYESKRFQDIALRSETIGLVTGSNVGRLNRFLLEDTYPQELSRKPKFKPGGSGVLVSKGNRIGILTAHHCLHTPGPEVRLGPTGTDTLFLVLTRGRSLVVSPQAVLERPLVIPKSEEFGPDLAFIEFLPGSSLNSVKAIGSIWSLDQDPVTLEEGFGKPGRLLASIGFPQIHYETEIESNTIRHQIRHMTYYFGIGPDDVFVRDGWDYIENHCSHGESSKLPESFAGMSGGPMWAVKWKIDAVTNTRFARSTGFRSALSPSRPRPFLCANRVLVTI